MMRRLLLPVALALLAVSPVADAAEITGAAVNMTRQEARFETAGGDEIRVDLQRIGLEYWETLAGPVQAGLELGYSESERRDTGAGVARGNYGGLQFRYRARFTPHIGLLATASWHLQDDEIVLDNGEQDIRIYETRALVAPEFHFGALRFAAGASWRRLDYRERRDSGGSLEIDLVEDAKVLPFASLGVRTDDDGMVRLDYFSDEQAGWRLQFERNF